MNVGSKVWLIRDNDVVAGTIKAVGDTYCLVTLATGERAELHGNIYLEEAAALRVLNATLRNMTEVVSPYFSPRKDRRKFTEYGIFHDVYRW